MYHDDTTSTFLNNKYLLRKPLFFPTELASVTNFASIILIYYLHYLGMCGVKRRVSERASGAPAAPEKLLRSFLL